MHCCCRAASPPSHRATTTSVPGQDKSYTYKVNITSVSDRPIGSNPVVKQASLLGRVITKKSRELCRELSPMFTPSVWIDYQPKD